MTTCSTLLALGMMPLLLFLYCQGIAGLENAVPYASISLGLAMTLVPCAIGVYINHRAPQYSKLITKVGQLARHSYMSLRTAIILGLYIPLNLGVYLSFFFH